MSILLVEDNPISAKIIEINLRKNGYEVISALNGNDALKELEASSSNSINLIITDIMMPEMNGLEFIIKIKENPKWKKVPFVITSAMSNKKVVTKAIEIGCRHFLVKPVQANQLLKIVEDLIPNQRLIIRDKNVNAAELGIPLETYLEIVRIFSELLQKQIEGLEKVIQQKSFGEIDLDFGQMVESATTLRAERLLDALEIVTPQADTGKTAVWNASKNYEFLLNEMKLLYNAITVKL